MRAALADAHASKAGADPQEAQGDTRDRRGTDADAFLALAPNSSFVLLIDGLLLMFAVMRMFPEQEAVTLVPLAVLSSMSCSSSAQVSEWAEDSDKSRPWGTLPAAPHAADPCGIQGCLILGAFDAPDRRMLKTRKMGAPKLGKKCIWCSERQP